MFIHGTFGPFSLETYILQNFLGFSRVISSLHFLCPLLLEPLEPSGALFWSPLVFERERVRERELGREREGEKAGQREREREIAS